VSSTRAPAFQVWQILDQASSGGWIATSCWRLGCGMLLSSVLGRRRGRRRLLQALKQVDA